MLVALVPAVCVLWFMTVAMRNERLAVCYDKKGHKDQPIQILNEPRSARKGSFLST